MLDQDVTAALCAITALADFATLKSPEEFFAFGDADIFFLPQRKRAYRRGGIMPAVLAMAVTHFQRITTHLDFYRPAVTLARMFLIHRFFDMAWTAPGLQPGLALC